MSIAVNNNKLAIKLLELSNDMLAIHSPEGKYLYVNKRFTELTGYSKEELIGNTPYDFFHPGDIERINRESHKRLLEGANTTEVEYRYKKKDNSYIWLSTTAKTNFNNQGEITEILTSSRDITELVVLGDEKIKNQLIWEQAGQLSKMGIWELDLETNQTTWSDAIFDIYDLPRGEMPDVETGIKYYDGEEAQQKITDVFTLAVTKGVAFEVKLPFLSDKKVKKWVRSIGLPQLGEDGKVEQVFGTIQDITLEKQLIESVSETNAFLRSITDNSHSFIIRTDMEGTITFANKHFLDVYGIEENEALGMDSLKTIVPEDWEKCHETVKRCLEAPGRPYYVQLRKVIPHTGIHFWSEWEFTAIVNKLGEVKEIQSFGYDTTKNVVLTQKLAKANEMLNQQNKKLRQFSYMISHNIRSNASNIKMLSSLIEDLGVESGLVDIDTLFKKISDSSDSLLVTLDSVNEVLSLLEDKTENYTTQSFERVLNTTKEALSSQISDSKAVISSDFRIKEHKLIKPYIENIFYNLIANAIRYAHPDRAPHILIRTWEENENVKLSFEDNGKGLDLKKYKGKLFEFSRTFHGNSDAKGVGLYLVKTQLELMNSEIYMESEIDKGSTFFITIKPRKRENPTN